MTATKSTARRVSPVDYLRTVGVKFDIIRHPYSVTARQTARVAHTPIEEFAKTVVLKIDGAYAIALVPVTRIVDLFEFAHLIGARSVTLADENEFAPLFPDCEVGAEPPLGPLYQLPVYVDRAVAAREVISFNGGTHHEAIRMRYEDFARLVEPIEARFSTYRDSEGGWFPYAM